MHPHFHLRVLLLVLSLILAGDAWALPWWNCDWRYRSEFSVVSDAYAPDQTVRVALSGSDFNPEYVFSPDGHDIRVVGTDQTTPIDFYLQDWDDSARTAVISVRFPAVSTTASTFYIYYGNSDASGNSTALPASELNTVFPLSGWRFNTRYSTLNPSNTAEARTHFESLPDSHSGYGCQIVDDVEGLSNQNAFSGPRTDFGLYVEAMFEATTAGVWSFRSGSDYGRGGAMYVDGVPLVERWNEDLWWGYNWNNSDVMTGSVNLTQGFHHFEMLGFEGCCDGTINLQFQSPGSSTWLDMNSTNLRLVNRACPVVKPVTSYVDTDSPVLFGGVTFLDNGAGTGGVAHDSAKTTGESGLESTEVTVTVVGTGTSETTTSLADGRWQTCFLDETSGSDVEISAGAPANTFNVSESTGTSNADAVLNSLVRFPAIADTDYVDVNFGYVVNPTLESDNAITVTAGRSGYLRHSYTATSSANVSFGIAQRNLNGPGVFYHSAFQDADCNGVLDSPSIPLSSPIAVVAGQVVCLVIKVDAGANVNELSALELQLDATTRYSNIPAVFYFTNVDNVSGSSVETLLLGKSVCNATQRSCNVTTGAGFVGVETGVPADELIYRVTFSATAGNVYDVSVHDVVPDYTKLKPSSIVVVEEPAGVSCEVVEPIDQASPGFTGTVKWDCTGEVLAADGGVVAFSVLID